MPALVVSSILDKGNKEAQDERVGKSWVERGPGLRADFVGFLGSSLSVPY